MNNTRTIKYLFQSRLFFGWHKPDRVIEKENKKYIISIAVVFDCQIIMYNVNSRKI